jgi:hypothetical protein
MAIQIQTSKTEPTITEKRLKKGCYVCDYSLFTESHHIIPLSKGGADEFKNRIDLCPNCHRAAHRGYISSEHLFILKSQYEEINLKYLLALNGRPTENLVHINSKSEAGKLGAIATKRNFGIEICPTCGRVKTSGFYAQNGAKGGAVTVALHGRDHMSRIGRRGGRPRS